MNGSIAELVTPELPYLRRFARALTGTQECGDAYVAALLEALIADRDLLDTTLKPRVAVFQAFVALWNAVPLNGHAEPAAGPREIVDRRIETLTPAPRQAFLLAGLEDFQSAEIAVIMRCDDDEVRRLIDRAGREIASQLCSRVIIIEDEPLIALDIESLVSDLGHRVVGIAATRAEATSLARRARPEMVLADIQLADGSSGVDAVNDILSIANMPVVFITAYPERLLTGQRPEPAFLVTKPFKPEMVKAVISQALFFDLKAGGAKRSAVA